jgi:hypothetical protein
MNPKFFGDSFDLVKRFFCDTLSTLGYEVIIDPMFTGDWNGKEASFYKLIGAKPSGTVTIASRPSALFIDPDIGVYKSEKGEKHVSYDRMVAELQNHSLVFAFDQSFSRGAKSVSPVLEKKLAAIRERGCHGFYYVSHARFLFISRKSENLIVLEKRLHELGLPQSRFVRSL